MKYQPPFVYGATPGVPGIHNADPDASYANGDPSIGQEGSYCPVEAWEHPQRELIEVIEFFLDEAPDHTDLTQVRKAIQRAVSGLDSLPIYPEIDTATNKLAITATTGQVVIDAGQAFRHRGHRVVNTTDTASGARTFATSANKTYHLRWTWASGAGTYSLVDMTAASPVETDASYDSSYDMMLIAKVVTNGANVPTVTALTNKAALRYSGHVAGGSPVGPTAELYTSAYALSFNYARVPAVHVALSYHALGIASEPNYVNADDDWNVQHGAQAVTRYGVSGTVAMDNMQQAPTLSVYATA